MTVDAPGVYTLNWDGLDDHGRKVANGVYFCHMAAPGYKDVGRTRDTSQIVWTPV